MESTSSALSSVRHEDGSVDVGNSMPTCDNGLDDDCDDSIDEICVD